MKRIIYIVLFLIASCSAQDQSRYPFIPYAFEIDRKGSEDLICMYYIEGTPAVYSPVLVLDKSDSNKLKSDFRMRYDDDIKSYVLSRPDRDDFVLEFESAYFVRSDGDIKVVVKGLTREKFESGKVEGILQSKLAN